MKVVAYCGDSYLIDVGVRVVLEVALQADFSRGILFAPWNIGSYLNHGNGCWREYRGTRQEAADIIARGLALPTIIDPISGITPPPRNAPIIPHAPCLFGSEVYRRRISAHLISVGHQDGQEVVRLVDLKRRVCFTPWPLASLQVRGPAWSPWERLRPAGKCAAEKALARMASLPEFDYMTG